MHNNTRHIVRLAQQQALSSFSELAGKMLLDANAAIVNALRGAPASEQKALTGARNWIHESERPFRLALLAKFTALLERAMETMHSDLRAGLHDIRADNLSLVNDEAMTREIELDRLAARLRDVDQMSLGRINLTIASLHGVSKVRERENPFRPYLAALALYESLRESHREPAVSKVLFDYMSTAMAQCLPGHYAAILAHFEARGLDARLLAQPSAMTPAQRERLNAQYGSGAGGQAPGMQALVWQVLDERPAAGAAGPPRTGTAPRAPTPQRYWLDNKLNQLQQAGKGRDGPETLSPLALSEQAGEKAEPLDRMTIDLVGLVFDFILREELLPAEMRSVIGRLHIPFLRAAVADPGLLQAPAHPARSLIDRLGTLAAAMRSDATAAPALRTEAARLVNRVRDTFDADMQVFAAAERDLDTAVATLLDQAGPVYRRVRDAIAADDAHGARLATLKIHLARLLAPLDLDPRLAAFIDTVWIGVMLRQDGAATAGLLPELIWSAQEKSTPAERTMLMRALPELVRRIREGIALLGLPVAASQAALDQLVAVHMDVLGQRGVPGGRSLSLDWLHVHFSQLGAPGAAAPAGAAARTAAVLEAVLASQALPARIHADPDGRDPAPVDAEWLARARPGAGFDTTVDGHPAKVRLEAVDAEQSIFIFSAPAPALPQAWRRDALLAAMHAGAMRPAEYAPLFERAVAAAMATLMAPTAS